MVKRAEGALLQSLTLDRTGPHALSVQICSGLRELILSGALKAGERLPATRTLAKELGVARTTIVESFDRLAAEGLLDTRVGAGTYVSAVMRNEPRAVPMIDTPQVTARAKLADAMASASRRFGVRLAHAPRPFTTAMPAFVVAICPPMRPVNELAVVGATFATASVSSAAAALSSAAASSPPPQPKPARASRSAGMVRVVRSIRILLTMRGAKAPCLGCARARARCRMCDLSCGCAAVR